MDKTVLVIGGGIAGMRAAAELLIQGYKIYLTESGPSIGGNMDRLEGMFPTDECAACAIQPLKLDLFDNPNLTILTSTEPLTLQGNPGAFSVELTIIGAEDQAGSSKEVITVGAVIVATGPEEESSEASPSRGETQELADRLGLELDEKGYFKRSPESGHPLCTTRQGVFMCGGAQGAKGIGESVIQACAASSGAAALLGPAGNDEPVNRVKKEPIPIKTADEPHIVAVFDMGGPGIKDLLDWEDLVEYSRSLPGVGRVETTPNAADGSKIGELLSTGEFNRLLVAGPSPLPNEALFQRLAENAGLNPYLLEMVNLHNQVARVHSHDRKEATEKAKRLMKMGVARVRQLEPLEELKVDITPKCLVIGGTPSGVACADRLAEMGIKVHLVDNSNNLAGMSGGDHPLVAPLITRITDNDDTVEEITQATVRDVQGCLGNFKVELIQHGKPLTLEAGAIVVTSGTSIEESSKDDPGFAESLALEKDSNGHYISTQGLMNLLDFTAAGVFNCGPARAVLETEDAVVDGEAAASRAAGILTSEFLVQSPVVSFVVDENCDGCAYCIDPCPTRSLILLEYVKDGTTKKVAEANTITCIGCGICMSTCPKKGIIVKHHKPEYYLEMVGASVVENESLPLIACFACNRCAYPGADAAGELGLQYPPAVLIIRTVCTGMIHPNIIIDALTQHGVDGVLVCGCHPGNCRSHGGILKAQARAEAIELMLEDFGLETERFRLELIAASEGPKFAQVVKEMSEELAALGPNPYKS